MRRNATPSPPSRPATYVRRFVSGKAHPGGTTGTAGGRTRMKKGVTPTHAAPAWVRTPVPSGSRGARSSSANGQCRNAMVSQRWMLTGRRTRCGGVAGGAAPPRLLLQ